MSKKTRFAIPTVGGSLTAHFGHCDKFAIVDVEGNTILEEKFINPPVHQPGVYPAFLAGEGVDIIIAGGMGQKARDLFAQNNISVLVGVEEGNPRQLVENYLGDNLTTGNNLCDH